MVEITPNCPFCEAKVEIRSALITSKGMRLTLKCDGCTTVFQVLEEVWAHRPVEERQVEQLLRYREQLASMQAEMLDDDGEDNPD